MHYSDAARAVVFTEPFNGAFARLWNLFQVANQCFLLSDGSPMTRRAILEATLKHPHFRWLVRIFQFETPDWSFHLEVKFTAGEGIDGKVFEIIPEVEVTVLTLSIHIFDTQFQTNPQVYNFGKVRDVLGWKPVFANFQQVLDLEAKLWVQINFQTFTRNILDLSLLVCNP